MGGFQEAIDGLLKQIKDFQSEKERIERELKESLDLQQDNRLKDLLEEFQYYIDSFFEDVKWETEEDKLTFMAQLKVSYDKSQKKSVAILNRKVVIEKEETKDENTYPPVIILPPPIDTDYRSMDPRSFEVILDGKSINGKDQAEIFVNTIRAIGIEKVRSLGLTLTVR